jgi:hypothetical protein
MALLGGHRESELQTPVRAAECPPPITIPHRGRDWTPAINILCALAGKTGGKKGNPAEAGLLHSARVSGMKLLQEVANVQGR